MQVYESVVWFIVGCFVAGVGGAVGSTAGLWVGWGASVGAGFAAAWASRRLPLIAGVAAVSAMLGALTATDVLLAALTAFTSVVLPATALLPSLPTRAQPAARPVETQRVQPEPPRPEPPRDSPPEPPPLLKEREVETILRLSETDTVLFQERLRALTSEQREQIRAALRARRAG